MKQANELASHQAEDQSKLGATERLVGMECSVKCYLNFQFVEGLVRELVREPSSLRQRANARNVRFRIFYGGQFTLLAHLIKPNYLLKRIPLEVLIKDILEQAGVELNLTASNGTRYRTLDGLI